MPHNDPPPTSPADDAALDTALEQTFPASDPSSSSGTIATVASSAAEDARIGVTACYVVVPARGGEAGAPLDDATADLDLPAASDGLLFFALTPAGAMLDWLAARAAHGGEAPERLSLLYCALPDNCIKSRDADAADADGASSVAPDAITDAARRADAAIAMRVPHPLCPQEYRLRVHRSQVTAIGLRIDATDVFTPDARFCQAYG